MTCKHFLAKVLLVELQRLEMPDMTSIGIPVGVIEVKRPDDKISYGTSHQIYDYMLQLRPFHGLKHVFGIVNLQAVESIGCQ
jgi:hypothetical protein